MLTQLTVSPAICLWLPSDSNLRRTSLPFSWHFPLAMCVENFHLQITRLDTTVSQVALAATRHAWLTKKKRHKPIKQVGVWLKRVIRGYFNYHAVPDNLKRLKGFRHAVCRAWFKLRRRSELDKMAWARFERFAKQYIPRPVRVHPYPPERFAL